MGECRFCIVHRDSYWIQSKGVACQVTIGNSTQYKLQVVIHYWIQLNVKIQTLLRLDGLLKDR